MGENIRENIKEDIKKNENIRELLQHITKDSLYQQWIKQHPQAYLSHFFCQVDQQFSVKSDWDIGFYEPEMNKIVVFTLQSVQEESKGNEWGEKNEESNNGRGSKGDQRRNKDTTKKTVIIKPADDIFQKEPAAIERLEMNRVNMEMTAAITKAQQALKENFSQEALGDGFLILQALQGKMLWNFTFITKALRFVNVKIDAQSGEEFSHEQVDLVQK